MTQIDFDSLFYREVQQFRQPWLWLAIAISSLSALYIGVQPFIYANLLENEPVKIVILIVFGCLFGVGLPLIFSTAKLISEVRYDGLYISFFPLLLSVEKIPLAALKSYQVRRYHPLREYGGWGIRYSPKGKAFNVSGDRGVQLELITGEKILIGSLSPEAFVKALDEALARNQ